ncbi:IclR family transcriptional regulator [Nocardiopsis sp. HNM0947]|uniref:IclR family transcriptional regulator n=1 Tax=Nocardiopsis coralli TaxID=2772213 RepID=A0ABR9P101_9ACTN|nr:IclR family transcriptional regulator [Nocardiopsis coralli]MBE2997526.1 IclR family transcriptional regulator [Nocardiopsis coralli]
MTTTPALPRPSGERSPDPSSRTAVDKALELMRFLGSHQEAIGVSELARRTGQTKSTAFRLLGILERNGMVQRQGTDYQLARKVYDLGARVHAPRQTWLAEVLTPFVAELYELTHETVHLATLRGTDVVYLTKLHGHRAVPAPSRVGSLVPAHCTAVGKSLLAHSPDTVEALLDRGLHRMTHRSLQGRRALQRELSTVRAHGLAYETEESAPGLRCVAAPVLGRGNRPVAALSVAGSTTGFDPERFTDRLRRIAYAASLAVKHAQARSAAA